MPAEHDSIYHDGQRELQEQFDSVRLADRLEEVMVHDRFSQNDREFIESLDMFFLATVGPDGIPSCSYKGGDPGFIRVVDDKHLVFPVYDGNGMFISAGNVASTAHVGLLFIDFERPRRMRVEGVARIVDAPKGNDVMAGAQFAIRVEALRIYPNCGRYIHRFKLVERSRFVPHFGETAPTPDWKRAPWAVDVLPEKDSTTSG
jgi:predicted pyridoxine 5'-phosphate oxidase superfamily flavin-nucleotide-binding protein